MNITHMLLVLLVVLLTGGQSIGAERVVYYHNDALGSPVAATDQNGEVIWREDYAPYGERLIKEDGGEEAHWVGSNRLWYTGKEEEEDLGLQYFGARWYDPSIGRFLSLDPAVFDEGNIHSFNKYAYANNNPYRYVDPDGRQSVLNFRYRLSPSAQAAVNSRQFVSTPSGLAERAPRGPLKNFSGSIDNAAAKSGRSVGAMVRREYQAASYHGKVGNAIKSKAPTNGQDALDMSVQVKGASPRRVGIDYKTGEFAVFDQTSNGVFHGHVRGWKDLTSQMQNSLRKSDMVDRKGSILGGSQ